MMTCGEYFENCADNAGGLRRADPGHQVIAGPGGEAIIAGGHIVEIRLVAR